MKINIIFIVFIFSVLVSLSIQIQENHYYSKFLHKNNIPDTQIEEQLPEEEGEQSKETDSDQGEETEETSKEEKEESEEQEDKQEEKEETKEQEEKES